MDTTPAPDVFSSGAQKWFDLAALEEELIDARTQLSAAKIVLMLHRTVPSEHVNEEEIVDRIVLLTMAIGKMLEAAEHISEDGLLIDPAQV